MFVFVLFFVPTFILSLWASGRVKSAFRKYSRIKTRSGVSGYGAARSILDRAGLEHVRIEYVGAGFLADHYDSRTKTLRLSSKVADECSVAAVGVAAHEAGHAVQDASNYGPLLLRQALVPVTQFSSWAFNALIFLGIFVAGVFHSYSFVYAAVICLGVTVLFSLVTLPVELNASSRARALLLEYGIVDGGEIGYVSRVLNAAALTYVAAAASTIMTFVYYLLALLSSDE